MLQCYTGGKMRRTVKTTQDPHHHQSLLVQISQGRIFKGVGAWLVERISHPIDDFLAAVNKQN